MLPFADRLAGGRFLLAGRAGMDLYAEPPGTAAEAASTFVAHLGGSSANVAVALARQGLRSALLTTVSDDAVGRFCLRQLAAYGVDTAYVRVVGGEARTSLAVAESRSSGYQCVIYRNGAADFALAPADVDRVDCAAFDALAFTGTALAAEPSRSAVFRAAGRARAAGLALIVDLDHRAYSWPGPEDAARCYARAAALCDVVVGNDDEFDVLAGGAGRGDAAARALAARGGVLVVRKLGAQGAVAYAGEVALRSGIFPVAALKPAGAGDAFLGALLAALAARRPLEACLRRAAAAGAIVVSRVGCAPAMPTAAEIDAFLAHAARPGGGPAAAGA